MIIAKKQISKSLLSGKPKSPSIISASHELEISDRKKEISIVNDERYTTIFISNSYKKSCNQVHVQTKVVKDRVLNFTETHIKKIFIHQKTQNSEVIIREIFTDRYKKTKRTESKSIRMKLNEFESLSKKMSLFFEKPTSLSLQLSFS